MQDKELIDALKKEIDSWRALFLEERFSGTFKHIPDVYKKRVAAYFLSTPSESFTNPKREWENCVCALLQALGEKEK